MDEHLYRSTTNAGLSTDLLAALAQPFPPHQVELRAGKREQRAQKWFCLAVPFVSQRFYEDRLNALVPGRWNTSTPSLVVAYGRFVIAAQVQIGTIVHTDYGERPLRSFPALEEMGTIAPHAQAAFEQAFVGACARFGLGRYLAQLERSWVPYDPRNKRIMLTSQEQADLVLALYKQANIPLPLERRASLAPSYPGWPPRESAHPGEVAECTDRPDEVAVRLRQRDLAWVRDHCDTEALQRIYQHFQISCLEELTDRQLVGVINGIHAHRKAS